MNRRCIRCGHTWEDMELFYCLLCFPEQAPPLYAIHVRNEGFPEPSPTIDILDLDLSALRALEEIARR